MGVQFPPDPLLFDFTALRVRDTSGQMPGSLFDPAIIPDPFPRYREYLEEHPVFFDEQVPGGVWLVSRHADVAPLLRDPRFSGDRMPLFRLVLRDSEEARAFDDSMSRWILFTEGTRHTKLRSLISKAFTPKMVAELRPMIVALTNELLDAVAPQGRTDFIADFAGPLPVRVIAQMLGLPASDLPKLREWSADLALFFGSVRGVKRAMVSDAAFRAYLMEVITERRRSEPRADLLSALTRVEEGGERLSDADILSTCIILFIAGHETTANLLGNGMLALLQNPDQLALLREDPSRIPAAVEELLRFANVTPFIGRLTRERIEIGGKVIEPGQMVVCVLGAANRDPAVFTNPNRLDVCRQGAAKHLAFGMGIHYCLGAPLARLEAAVAFDVLLSRFPKLRLGDPAPTWGPNVSVRALSSLPLALA
jgi:pimeloyl-[acyl-carrier protein] synthase